MDKKLEAEAAAHRLTQARYNDAQDHIKELQDSAKREADRLRAEVDVLSSRYAAMKSAARHLAELAGFEVK